MVFGVDTATPSGAVMLIAGWSAAIALASAALPAVSGASAWCCAAYSPSDLNSSRHSFISAACSPLSSCLPPAESCFQLEIKSERAVRRLPLASLRNSKPSPRCCPAPSTRGVLKWPRFSCVAP